MFIFAFSNLLFWKSSRSLILSSPSDGLYSSLSAAQALATEPLGRFTVFARDTSWKANLAVESWRSLYPSGSISWQDVSVSFHLLGLDICSPHFGQCLMSQMAHAQCPTSCVNTSLSSSPLILLRPLILITLLP